MLTSCRRLLIISGLPLLALIARLKRAAADDASDHPGRCGAVRTAEPIVGCAGRTNSLEQVPIFAEAPGVVRSDGKDLHDPEYLRMVEWVRRTCSLLAQPENLR